MPGTLFSVPDTSCPILPLFLYLSHCISSSRPHQRLLHPERPGNRTNSGFDDPKSDATSAPHGATRYSNAELSSSGEAQRGPTDTAVIHLAAGFRDSLTFLRIGPCRRRETRDVSWPAARGHISACFVSRQTGTLLCRLARGRSSVRLFRRARSSNVVI